MATATIANTLKKYYESFVRRRKIENAEMSFDRYRRENYEDYNRNYTDALEEHRKNQVRAKSSFGKSQEALRAGGYQKSGYAERVKKRTDELYRSEEEALRKKRDNRARNAKQDYASYLENYDRRQIQLYNNVVRELTETGITSPESAYKYAIAAGLHEERARAAIESVRSRLLEKAKSHILELCEKNEISPEAAEVYARTLGLGDEDVEYLTEVARKYIAADKHIYDSYLEYLEEMSKYK